MTITQRLVDIAARPMGRRKFLGRAALVGSATLVNPVNFLFRPNSAYAAVSGGPGLCGTGYTEFCCTLTGVNACPAGTVTGGWWKVDGSSFCGGAPRFYLDCNAQCGDCGCGSRGVCDGGCSGTGCGCALGDPDNWKTGCNKFRYGQCNQNIPCLGPIVCRVATCTPPWLFDFSCTTSSRTDEATRYHTRPCLQESFGAIDLLKQENGTLEIGGWAMNQDDFLDAAVVRVYLDGFVAAEVRADIFRPDVAAVYTQYGPNHGFHLVMPIAPGKHYVCIFAVDPQTGIGHFLNFQEIDIPTPLAAIDLARSELDGSMTFAGWGMDPAQPNVSPQVRLYVDGTFVAEVTADVSRPDVGTWLGIDDRVGFSFNVPNVSGSEACMAVMDRFGAPYLIGCVPTVAA